jgi:hypothetical protein
MSLDKDPYYEPRGVEYRALMVCNLLVVLGVIEG